MITKLTEDKSLAILANNYIGTLAYIFNDEPYAIPITYFFDGDDTIICYSHEGHKTKALRKTKSVALLTTQIDDVNHWKSVQIHGTFKEIEGSSAKACLRDFANGIKKIAKSTENINYDFIGDFSSKSDEKNPVVFKININKVTGREENK